MIVILTTTFLFCSDVTLSDDPIDDDSPVKEIADLLEEIGVDFEADDLGDIGAETVPVQHHNRRHHDHHHRHERSHGHHT